MRKRLIVILALVLVAGLTAAAYAEVQNVKVSGDITVLGASRNLTLAGPKNTNDKSFIATIARVKVDADLTDQVMATIRVLNERYWGNESENGNTLVGETSETNTNIVLDLANVTLKEFLYSPLTLIVGRQELHFGNDMIIGDPDTNNQTTIRSPFGATIGYGQRDADLTARKAFDAIRATLNYDPLVVDAIYAKVTTRNSQNIANDDTNIFGINANYKVDAKTTVEAYWFEKNVGKKAPSTSNPKKSDRVDTVGARGVVAANENLIYQLEMAYQFGKKVDSTKSYAEVANRKAWALEAAATYNFTKAKYTPSTTLLYAYFSGDHENNTYNTNNGTYKGWDPMFENQKFGDIANTQFDQTNAHILGGIGTLKPADDIILKAEYYAFWWAKAYPEGSSTATRRGDTVYFTQRRFVGQELDLTATYNYTEDVQFSLMGGWFVPGPSIDKEKTSTNQRTKLASEVIGCMKVTF